MSFRARLLLVMLVLTIGIQLVVSWAVLSALKTTAMEEGEKELGVASGVAQALLDGWGQQLLHSVDLLVEDPRFREAIDPLDSAVRGDVLGEYAERMGANMVSLLDDEGRVLVSSHHEAGTRDAFPDLRDPGETY